MTFGGQGSWRITSDSNPKWNRSGRGFISGLFGPINPSIEEMIEALKKELGEPPDDLEVSWMKD